MNKVVYEEKEIATAFRILENITVKGAENAKYLAALADILSKGKIEKDKEDPENGSKDSL